MGNGHWSRRKKNVVAVDRSAYQSDRVSRVMDGLGAVIITLLLQSVESQIRTFICSCR